MDFDYRRQTSLLPSLICFEPITVFIAQTVMTLPRLCDVYFGTADYSPPNRI